MPHRDARPDDLPGIVEIYNATIPGRQATAHDEPVTVASRRPWFAAHGPDGYPLWVVEGADGLVAWLSFSPFHERPAYRGTAELSVYVAHAARGHGIAGELVDQAVAAAPGLGIHTLVGLVFGHNRASLDLFEGRGFERWGRLPGVAVLDDLPRDLVILGRRVGRATTPSVK